MPTETSIPVQENTSAFLGLQSYTEANANSFFGRDTEIDATTSLIQLNSLTIVFGRSGTGKTSLLNAGVFPKLRKNYCLPFRIRLEFNKESPDLVTQVKNVLRKEIDKYGFNVQTYPGEETLWEYFHKELLWISVTPILVFDQFEEIFTLAKSDPRWANEMTPFWEELSDLIENNIPKKLEPQFLNHREQITYNYKTQRTKIVFAFREEYLPEFETLTAKIPSLKFSRYRLLPMNGDQAYDVITKNWKENINPSEANKIISYFTRETEPTDKKLITVEPSLLSQVCTYIDKERMDGGGGKVSAELLNRYPKETILRSIYDEAAIAANSSLHFSNEANANRNLIKEFVEEKLITTQGYRTKYNLGASDEMLKPGINVLAAKYFVREDDNEVELTHDVLAPIIKSDREKRRNEIAKAAERKKAWKKALLILKIVVPVVLALLLWSADKVNKANKANKEAQNARDRALRYLDSLRSSGAGGIRIRDSIRIITKDSLRIRDSIRITDITNSNNPSNSADNSELRSLRMRLAALISDTAELGSKLRASIKTNAELKSKYDSLFEKYKDAIKEIEKLRKDLADCIRNNPPRITPCEKIDTTNSLLLDLNYKQLISYYPSLRPQDIKIFLVPYTGRNLKIIRASSVYDTYDETMLEKAEGSIRGHFCAPYYIFPNVPAGNKYLLKVCTLYGTFKTYIKNAKGSETLKLDAVLPVKARDR